jgi:hypothetical protein
MIYVPSASNKGQGPAPSWIQHIHSWIFARSLHIDRYSGSTKPASTGRIKCEDYYGGMNPALAFAELPYRAVSAAVTPCPSCRDMLLINSLDLDTTQVAYANTFPSDILQWVRGRLTVVFYASKASPDETLGYYASSEHEAQPTRSYWFLYTRPAKYGCHYMSGKNK